MNVAVIIPALNEERSIPRVLADLPWHCVDRVIVVDNGSTDRTAAVARQGGAAVVLEPRRGYGSACLKGLELLRQDPQGPPEIVVFLDADYSDHPEELPKLLQPICERDYDFVLGSRLQGIRQPGAMPAQSIFGNKLACWLMRWFFGARYTDLGPFRAIRWDALESLHMCDTNYGWTVEMQIKAARAGLRTCEVPVRYRPRIGTSKISGTLSGSIAAGCKILWLIFKYGFLRRVPGDPEKTACEAVP